MKSESIYDVLGKEQRKYEEFVDEFNKAKRAIQKIAAGKNYYCSVMLEMLRDECQTEADQFLWGLPADDEIEKISDENIVYSSEGEN